MSSEAKDLSLISELISKDLQLAPYDAWSTSLCKTRTKIEDLILLFSLYRSGIAEVHRAGSIAEGTTVEASDSDMMFQWRGIEILKSENACVNVRKDIIYFVSDSSKCNPGYVRLKPSEHSKSMYHSKLQTDLSDYLQPMSDGSYLSSEWFRYLMVSLTPEEDKYPNYPFKTIQHGPCSMYNYEYLYREIDSKQAVITEYDTAYALTYRGWPEEAIEWKTRDRKFDWPTPTLISKISELGCHAVPVGDSSSATCSLEWRQSFLLCEKELIWNFNDTQIQCYVIMKRLIKKYIDPFAPDQISSYNLKTVIFWVSEELGLNAWTPAKLLHCLKGCLARLSHCIECRNLPHYFVRKANLFRNRFLSPDDKIIAIEKLRNVTDNIVISTMEAGLPPNSKICKLWNDSNKNLHMFLSEGVKIRELSEKHMATLLLTRKIELHRAEFLVMKRYTSNFLTDQIVGVTLPFLNGKHLEVDETVAARARNYLHIRRGLEHLQKTKQSDDERKKGELQRIALYEIENGSKLDMLSGQLYLATYYMSVLNLPKCISVIEECLAKLPSKMFYTGYCSSNPFMEIENGKLLKSTAFDIPPDKLNALETTFDMLFAREDYAVVPSSLVFACALLPQYGEKYVAIHPFVYAYHLLHLAKVMWEGPSSRTKEILDYLEDLVLEFCDTPHLFNALNVIGFSEFLVGKNVEAFGHFASSLQLSATMPKVKNGAAWWMAIFFHALQSPSTETFSEAEMEKINRFR
ncbi:uncharacterized protein LOC123534891 [Mercenaria mercenaria]|uniref:uncharacterized protein LOC123534891 n=1 Tax=Mercenaria mercenaria TaxID=6596 RepID=UPI001E1DAC09|nr:uncharacterized protein LOC123534891 [Mercenaria mercenaria]